MDDEKVDKLFESMQGDPTMGGTVRALAAAVMRLADENLALSERLTRLAGLAGIKEVGDDADGEEAPATAAAPTEELVEADFVGDAEYARLLHETALPPASVKIIEPDGSETEISVEIGEFDEGDEFPDAEW